MNEKTTETMLFRMPRERSTASEVLISVYESMREKGYDPINQIVGYLISGDPTYITSYNNARYRICSLQRDELVEELVRHRKACLPVGKPRICGQGQGAHGGA